MAADSGGPINEEMEDMRAELELAYERIRELQDAAVDSGVAELQSRLELSEDRMRDVEARLHQSQNEADRYREHSEALEAQLAESDRQRRDEVRARDELADVAGKLRTQLDRVTDELARERSRASDAAVAGARAVKDRQFQNSELDKAVQEGEELREEVKALGADLEAYREAVAQLQGELEDGVADREALEGALSAANGRLAELMHEVAEAHASAQAAQATVEAKNAEIASLGAQLEEAGRRAAVDLKAASDRTAAVERTVTSLQLELRAVKEATRVRELEDEAAGLRASLAAMTAQRDELAGLLEEQTSQLERVTAEMASLKEARDARVAEAVAAERARLSSLSRDLQEEAGRAAEERSRVAEVQAQKAEVEAALADAHARLQSLAAEHGLEDAIAEQERLRGALRLRDADIARLTSQAALQLDSYDCLEEIARRLAERAGYARGTDVWTLYPDTAELKSAIASSVERMRSANVELSRQNDALEEQRAKLLRQLRVHAENTGDKALRYYGLAPEQLFLVNEFAENLRNGTVEIPVNDRTLELLETVRALRGSVKDLEEQLYLARASGAVAVRDGGHGGGKGSGAGGAVTVVAGGGDDERLRQEREELAAARAQVAAQQAAAAAAEATARALAASQGELQSALTRLAQENAGLRAEVGEMAAAQERRFAQLSSEREAEARTSRELEVTRLATLKAAMAMQGGGGAGVGEGPPGTLFSAETEGALAEIYRILRDKLDSSLPLDAGEMAALYRAFAQLITGSEAAARRLESAIGAERAARERADTSARELAQLRDAFSQQGTEYNTLLRAHAAATRSREEAEAAHAAALAEAAAAAGGGPHTAGGRALLRRRLEGLPQGLRADGSGGGGDGDALRSPLVGELADAHAALVEALEEVAAKEEEGRRYEGLIRQYNGQLGALAAQHTALYRSYVGERAQWELQLAQAREREQVAAAKAEGLAAVQQRLAELGAASAPTTDASSQLDAITSHAKAVTRQLAALEMVQPALVRKYNHVKAELAAARAAARTCELAGLEGECHLRQRILYLELWKKGAEGRLERLTQLAQGWVPGEEHAEAVASLTALQQRHTDLLAAEAQLRAAYVALRELPRTVQGKEAEVAALQAELARSQEQAAAAGQAAAMATAALEAAVGRGAAAATGGFGASAPGVGAGAFTGSGHGGTAAFTPSAAGVGAGATGGGLQSLLAHATPGELLLALSKQSAALAETQVALAAAERRCELLQARAGSLETALVQASAGSHAAEDALAGAREAAAVADAEAAALRRHLEAIRVFAAEEPERGSDSAAAAGAGGEPQASYSATIVPFDAAPAGAQGPAPDAAIAAAIARMRRLQQRVSTLSAERDALSSEVTKARSLADIAADQAAAATGLLRDREGEVADLQEQVRALSSRGDDDAIIGRLQAALLSLKAAFHGLLRRHDALRLAWQRSRVASLALEVSVDGRQSEVLALREEGRVRELALHRALTQLRTQLRGMGRTGFTLQQAQAFNTSIRRLAGALDASQRDATAQQARLQEAETAAAVAGAEAEGLRRLADDLRALVGGAAGTGAGVDGASAAASAASSRQVARRLSELHESLQSERVAALRLRREGGTLREELRLARRRGVEAEGRVGELERRMVGADMLARHREEDLRRQLSAAQAAAAAAAGAGGEASSGGLGSPAGGFDGEFDDSAGAGPRRRVRQGAGAGDTAASLALLATPPPSDLPEALDQLRLLRQHYGSLYAQHRQLVEAGRALLTRAHSRRHRLLAALRALNSLPPSLGGGGGEGSDGPFAHLTAADPLDSGLATDDGDVRAGPVARLLLAAPREGQPDGEGAGDAHGATGDSLLGGTFSGAAATSSAQPGSGLPAAAATTALVLRGGAGGGGATPGAAADAAAATLAELREHYEGELLRLRRAGAATQASLRQLLEAKNGSLEEARARLEGAREAAERARAAAAAERERVVAAAYEESAATIERLRGALRELEASTGAGGGAGGGMAVNEQLVRRADELEGALEARGRHLREAEVALAAVRDALAGSQERLAATVARAEAAEREVASLQRRLGDSAASLADRDAGAAGAVATLQAQLAARDRKLRALTASLGALKAEFVRAEEEHAVALAQLAGSGRGAAAAAAAARQRSGGGGSAAVATGAGAGAAAGGAAASGASGAGAANASGAATPAAAAGAGAPSAAPSAAGLNATGSSAAASPRPGEGAAAAEGEGGEEESPALLRARIGTLAEAVGRMREEVVALRSREQTGEAARARLARESDRMTAELGSLRQVHAACEARERSLRQEADRLAAALAAAQRQLGVSTSGSGSSRLPPSTPRPGPLSLVSTGTSAGGQEGEGEEEEAIGSGSASATGGAGAPLPSSAASSSTAGPASMGGSGLAASAAAGADSVAALLRRIRVLEAQNAALQAASGEEEEEAAAERGFAGAVVPAPLPASAPPAATGGSGGGAGAAVLVAGLQAQLAPLQAQVSGLQERLRSALESERRARKRVEALSRTLAERAKEVEEARGSEGASQAALGRVKGERDSLEKRLVALQRKHAALEAAAAAAYAEMEPVAALRATIASLQDTAAELRLRCDGELPATVARLRAELQGAAARAEAAEADAAETRARLRALGAGDAAAAAAAGGSTAPDDRWAVEAALRERVAEGKRSAANLEARVRAQEATVLELRFEAEAARQTADRLRQRVAEVSAFATIAGRGRPLDAALSSAAAGGAAAGGGQLRKPGDTAAGRPATAGGAAPPAAAAAGGGAAAAAASSRREAELHDLVTALRRVTDKQKAELERLRAQLTSAQGAAALAAHAHPSGPGAVAEGVGGPLGPRATAGGSVPASEAAAAVKELRAARAEAGRLRDRVAALEGSLKEAEAAAAAKEAELARLRAQAAATHVQQQQQGSARRGSGASQSAALAGAASGAGGGKEDDSDAAAAAGTIARLQARADALASENASLKGELAGLREELAAFDASFFEELEDLKWAYAQAADKCRAFDAYLQRHPPPAGAAAPDVSFPARRR